MPDKKMAGLSVSFVILTWNSEKYLERCILTIEESLDGTGITYEILVLDNGSKDGTPGAFLGVTVFDETLHLDVVLGGALLMGAALFTLLRARVAAKRAARP